jgi:hypothetical protein
MHFAGFISLDMNTLNGYDSLFITAEEIFKSFFQANLWRLLPHSP